ncbi:MAG: hypothetical protein GY851_15680 [bacterium]|nr:hypothetical protein [bacterium]
MDSVVSGKLDSVCALCQKWRVRRLDLFGSGATGSFEPGASDLDFLVTFEAMPPQAHADAFFGLLADLEDLLGTAIDLVEEDPIQNPYLREAVDGSKVLLYAA